MALTLQVGKCSLQGNVRSNNEDTINVLETPAITLCIVADGMGGQAAGEVASQYAVEFVSRQLSASIVGGLSNEEIKQKLTAVALKANQDVLALAAQDRRRKSMGSTLLLALAPKGSGQLFIASLGDSRAYQVRGKKITQLTVDHTITQALLDAKTITAAQAKTHPFRNSLCKFIGCPDLVDGPDVKMITLQAGDRFLLCSDGISGVVPDDQLATQIKAATDMQACAEALCQLALDQGSRDNVSGIVIGVA